MHKEHLWRAGLRVLVWCGIAAILIWLLWQSLVPTGKKVIIYEVGKPTIAVTAMRPGESLSVDHTEEGRTFYVLKNYPLFFHVRTPGAFESARVTLDVRAAAPANVAFGGQTGQSLSEFLYIPLAAPSDMQWHLLTTDIDLTKLRYNSKDRRYQFSFAGTGELSFASMRFELTRKGWW